MIFRREPLHKKLAREARLEQSEPAPFVDPGPHWGVTGIHGVPRPRRWDAVASAEAPDLSGEEVHFVALPDGDLVVDEDVPDGSAIPLADALEQTIARPYRAEAVRRGDDVWAVAARTVEVAELEAQGDEIERVVTPAESSLTVDGAQVFGSIPILDEIGKRLGDWYVVRARRLDADLWEIEADPL